MFNYSIINTFKGWKKPRKKFVFNLFSRERNWSNKWTNWDLPRDWQHCPI